MSERASVESVLRAPTVARMMEVAREAGPAPRGRLKDEIASSIAVTKRVGFR